MEVTFIRGYIGFTIYLCHNTTPVHTADYQDE